MLQVFPSADPFFLFSRSLAMIGGKEGVDGTVQDSFACLCGLVVVVK